MKHGIYVYYDRVAETFVSPLLTIAPNDEAAVRDFVNMLLSEQFPKDKNIGDYDLLRLASYDLMANAVCEVIRDPSGRPLCTGVHVRTMKREIERKKALGVVEDNDCRATLGDSAQLGGVDCTACGEDMPCDSCQAIARAKVLDDNGVFDGVKTHA